MNQTIRDIIERRSIRSFKSDMVPREVIDEIIEAGLYAPSSMGKQASIIVAVTDKKWRDKLSEANSRVMGQANGGDPFYGAPVVLIVLSDKAMANRVYDGSLVMGNLMLAAHSLGIGSCWIHRAKEVFEMDEYKEFLRAIGVKGEYEGIGHCVLGYAEGDTPKGAKRKEHRVFYAD